MNDVNSKEPANITRGELSQLMGQLTTLSQQVAALTNEKADVDTSSGRRHTRQVKHRDVTVLFLDNKPVVGLEPVGTGRGAVKIYQQPDPKKPDQMLLMANPIILDPKTNKTEVIKGVVWPEFLVEADKRECRVVKQRGERWVIEQGEVRAQNVKEGAYKPTDLGVDVPVDIEGTEYHYVIDVDGVGVEIHEDYVNMAKSSPEFDKQYVGSTQQGE